MVVAIILLVFSGVIVFIGQPHPDSDKLYYFTDYHSTYSGATEAPTVSSEDIEESDDTEPQSGANNTSSTVDLGGTPNGTGVVDEAALARAIYEDIDLE